MSVQPSWSTACPDWKSRIVAKQSLIAFPYLFPHNAEEALDVFGALRLRDVKGKPLLSEVTLPWAREFVGHIFGSYDDETGRRLISEYFLLISKKNTKSTTAAAIMMTALILNWRESAEFLILSPTIEIANNSFKPAADMVREDPELEEMFHVQDHTRTITHRLTGAVLKVVAASSETVSGKKAVGVLVDELWLFGKNARADDMLREATGGLASAPEGFVIYLTTQSDEPPTGVFKKKLEYARAVRDGEIEDNGFLPILYEFPAEMIEAGQHMLEANFYVTNPNLGVSVDEPFLLRNFKKAQQSGEEEMRGFLAKHLNVEIGMNLRADRWPGAEFWLQAQSPLAIYIGTLIERCDVICVGIDGGGLDDLLGACFLGRDKTTRHWLSWCVAWAHPSVLQRRKDVSSKLIELSEKGELHLVENIGEDVEQLAEMVARIEESGLLYKVGLDPSGLGGILDGLLQAGVPEDKMTAVNQGWRLAGSIKTTERKLAEGVLLHDGSALMKWCVGNAKVKLAGNSVVITKQISGSAKIDPLLALINAVALMSLNPPSQIADYNFDNMVIVG